MIGHDLRTIVYLISYPWIRVFSCVCHISTDRPPLVGAVEHGFVIYLPFAPEMAMVHGSSTFPKVYPTIYTPGWWAALLR